MKVYIYRERWYCDRCGRIITRQLVNSGKTENPDRDLLPRDPFGEGGGKADAPRHCDACRVLLENPLTANGDNYVLDRAAFGLIPVEWRRFYDELFSDSIVSL